MPASPLRKYDTLLRDIWQLLGKPVGEKLSMRIPAAVTRPRSAQIMRDLLRKAWIASSLAPSPRCVWQTLAAIKEKNAKATKDPELYIESIKTTFAEAVNLSIIAPLLTALGVISRTRPTPRWSPSL